MIAAGFHSLSERLNVTHDKLEVFFFLFLTISCFPSDFQLVICGQTYSCYRVVCCSEPEKKETQWVEGFKRKSSQVAITLMGHFELTTRFALKHQGIKAIFPFFCRRGWTRNYRHFCRWVRFCCFSFFRCFRFVKSRCRSRAKKKEGKVFLDEIPSPSLTSGAVFESRFEGIFGNFVVKSQLVFLHRQICEWEWPMKKKRAAQTLELWSQLGTTNPYVTERINKKGGDSQSRREEDLLTN